VRGFFASVVARIGVPEVSERLMKAIDVELGGAPEAAFDEDAADLVEAAQ